MSYYIVFCISVHRSNVVNLYYVISYLELLEVHESFTIPNSLAKMDLDLLGFSWNRQIPSYKLNNQRSCLDSHFLSMFTSSSAAGCNQPKFKTPLKWFLCRWTDMTAVDFTNWAASEPNDAFGGERCVEFRSKFGKFN